MRQSISRGERFRPSPPAPSPGLQSRRARGFPRARARISRVCFPFRPAAGDAGARGPAPPCAAGPLRFSDQRALALPRRNARWRLSPGRADSAFRAGASGLLAVLLAEALDASRGIDELLLAREEGVARGADVGVNLRLGRPCLICISASATNGGGCVHWMDIWLHFRISWLSGTAWESS